MIEANHSSFDGATKLAERLRAYWLDHGRDFRSRVVAMSAPLSGGQSARRLYGLRSNAVNGTPPELGSPEAADFGPVFSVDGLGAVA